MKYWPIVFSSIIALSCTSDPTKEEPQETNSDASIVGVWKLDSSVVYHEDTLDINLDYVRPYLESYENGTLLFNHESYMVFSEDSTAYIASNYTHRDTLRKQWDLTYEYVDQKLCITFSNDFTDCDNNLVHLDDSNMVWFPFYELGGFTAREHYSKVNESEVRNVFPAIEN
jgi:hypothetical protein